MNGNDLMKGIELRTEAHHDTVYCTQEQARTLERQATTPGFSGSIDNLRILGLDVMVLPRLELPIVCQKGEVFDLAKDYKNGDESL